LDVPENVLIGSAWTPVAAHPVCEAGGSRLNDTSNVVCHVNASVSEVPPPDALVVIRVAVPDPSNVISTSPPHDEHDAAARATASGPLAAITAAPTQQASSASPAVRHGTQRHRLDTSPGLRQRISPQLPRP
jgi:hypothetical protein